MPPSSVALPRTIAERQVSVGEIPTALPYQNEARSSGITWSAVVGGAFVSAALSLILLSLGTGLGFSAISPWSNMSTTAAAIGKTAIAWLIVTQIMSSALGGYLAGRLRTKWVNVHTDEVYFRDTAHGLLVWALGMVVTAAFLGTAATAIAGGSVQRATNANGSATVSEGSVLNPNAYLIDTMLRSATPVAERNDVADRSEAERIFAHGMRQGSLTPSDNTYLAQLVAARTGVSPAEADGRVANAFDEAQRNADAARKALAHFSLWLFVALLTGAFVASYAGTVGGRQRDRVQA
jgi:hypothetical protein